MSIRKPTTEQKGRMNSRREFLKKAGLIAGGSMATGLAAACSTPQPAAPAAGETPAAAATQAPAASGPKYGGTLTWAIEQDVVNLIPFGASNTSNHWGKEHIYESLVQWDKDLMVQPALATSWETPDDKTWIFHLREGAQFHSGDELTAEDVKYSFELQADPPPPGTSKTYYPKIESIEAVDKYTVKFNMTGPDPTMLGYLAWGRFSPVAPKDAYDRWSLTTEGIGTNVFKLVQYVANDRLEYVKYDNYWQEDLPHLDELVLKVLPDENARVAALRSGQIDGCFLQPDSAQIVESDPNITVLSGLFSAPRVLQFTLKNEGKPWEDVRVRQAISKAINRQEVIDKVHAGQAVLSGPIPPGYGDWFIPPEELAEKWLEYDLEEAKALMVDAGYENGFDITLHAIANHDASQTAEVVKEQLKAININVNIIAEEIGTFAKRVGEGDYEWCSTHRGMRHDPASYLIDFCRTDYGNLAHWFNDGKGYRNEESLQLYEDLVVTLDSAKRHEQARKIQENVLTDMPHVYICQPYWFHGVQSYVKDMYPSYTQFYPGFRTAWLDK